MGNIVKITALLFQLSAFILCLLQHPADAVGAVRDYKKYAVTYNPVDNYARYEFEIRTDAKGVGRVWYSRNKGTWKTFGNKGLHFKTLRKGTPIKDMDRFQ